MTGIGGNSNNWASEREKYTVGTAIFIALVAFSAIVVACFFKDVTTAEKIVAILVSFVSTPIGYLFGYSGAKSSEIEARKDTGILQDQVSNLSLGFNELKDANTKAQEIIKSYDLAYKLKESDQ
jgi:hypothetical protein